MLTLSFQLSLLLSLCVWWVNEEKVEKNIKIVLFQFLVVGDFWSEKNRIFFSSQIRREKREKIFSLCPQTFGLLDARKESKDGSIRLLVATMAQTRGKRFEKQFVFRNNNGRYVLIVHFSSSSSSSSSSSFPSNFEERLPSSFSSFSLSLSDWILLSSFLYVIQQTGLPNLRRVRFCRRFVRLFLHEAVDHFSGLYREQSEKSDGDSGNRARL